MRASSEVVAKAYGEKVISLGKDLKLVPGETLRVVAHGDHASVAYHSPAELASRLLDNGVKKGTPIDLRACGAGICDYASLFAKEMSSQVTAYTAITNLRKGGVELTTMSDDAVKLKGNAVGSRTFNGAGEQIGERSVSELTKKIE